MIEITINIPALDRIASAMEANIGGAPATDEPAKKTTVKKKTTAKKTAKVKEEEPEPSQDPAEGITKDSLVGLAQKLVTLTSPTALREALDSCGVERISGADESQYPAIKKALEAAML